MSLPAFDSFSNITSPGFIFDPSESELVSYYLCGKIQGKLNHFEESIIQTCDIYGEEEPWEIWERFGGGGDVGALRLFTKLKKKNVKGKRSDRTAGGGTWHAEGPNKPSELVFDGKLVSWTRRRYNYKNARSPHHHCCWNMLEYSCSLSPDLVVVVLKRNKPGVYDGDITAVSVPKPKQPRKSKVCRVDDQDSDQSEISGAKVAVFQGKNPSVDASPSDSTQEKVSKKRKMSEISSTLVDQEKLKKSAADQSDNSGFEIWKEADDIIRVGDQFSTEDLENFMLSFDVSETLVDFDFASSSIEHRSDSQATSDGSIAEGRLDLVNDGFYPSDSFISMMGAPIRFDSSMDVIIQDPLNFGECPTMEAGFSGWTC